MNDTTIYRIELQLSNHHHKEDNHCFCLPETLYETFGTNKSGAQKYLNDIRNNPKFGNKHIVSAKLEMITTTCIDQFIQGPQ